MRAYDRGTDRHITALGIKRERAAHEQHQVPTVQQSGWVPGAVLGTAESGQASWPTFLPHRPSTAHFGDYAKRSFTSLL
jgi:hypothetical protein